MWTLRPEVEENGWIFKAYPHLRGMSNRGSELHRAIENTQPCLLLAALKQSSEGYFFPYFLAKSQGTKTWLE